MEREITFKESEGINIVEFNKKKYYLTEKELKTAQQINNIKHNMAMFCRVVDEMKLMKPNYGYAGREKVGDAQTLIRMFIDAPDREGLFNQLVYSDSWAADGGALEEEVVADGTSELVDNERNDDANVIPPTTPKKKKKKKKSINN